MVAKETPASANAAGNKSAANKTAANKSANKKPAAKQAAKAGSTEPDKKGFRPEPPPPIGYWDLPDSIRSNVPEIKYSVLVYANDPSDRFVLISGEGLKEGDVVSAGLKVKEIRRDGIIFKYRLYEFLVEK
jgi:general secretion pathway protein B